MRNHSGSGLRPGRAWAGRAGTPGIGGATASGMGIPLLGVGSAGIWAATGAVTETPAAGWPKAPPGAAVGASLPGGTWAVLI